MDIYRRLQMSTSLSNIVSFYGSFIQNDTRYLILEYTDKGNLEEYFQRVPPPQDVDSIRHFWVSLCGIFKALSAIHEVEPRKTPLGNVFDGFVAFDLLISRLD